MDILVSSIINDAFLIAPDPDENFAREIMQLFTIGLDDLEIDGSVVADQHGNGIKSYTSRDIVSFARAWTGFKTSHNWNTYYNMYIDVTKRDWWPKRGLNSKFIGDRYPLCVSLDIQLLMNSLNTIFIY